MIIDIGLIETREAAIVTARAAMQDPKDLPRTYTEREFEDYCAKLQKLDQIIPTARGTREGLRKPLARLEENIPALDKHKKVRETLEADKAALVAEGRDVPADLDLSLLALDRGADYVDGFPMLPSPLSAMLTTTCPTCNHSTLTWRGPIAALEEQITRDRKRVDENLATLDRVLRDAEALIAAGEPV